MSWLQVIIGLVAVGFVGWNLYKRDWWSAFMLTACFVVAFLVRSLI